MPATFLDVFIDGNLLRYATSNYLVDDPRCVAALASSCTTLWSVPRLPLCMLSLPQSDLKFWPLFAESHYLLHGVTLRMPARVDDRRLVQIMNCGSLHTLNITGCSEVTDVAGLGQCASLHTLNLSGCRGVTNVAGLGQCASLHTVNLRNCTGVADVAGLGQCASLHTLNLSDCRGVTDVAGLGQCASLHTLNLSRCRGVTDVTGLG